MAEQEAKQRRLRLARRIFKWFGAALLAILLVLLLIEPVPQAGADSTTLNASYSVVLFGGDTWTNAYISSGYWNEPYRTGIDFNTSAIPDTATITKVELKLYIDAQATPLNNDVGKMTSSANAYRTANIRPANKGANYAA